MNPVSKGVPNVVRKTMGPANGNSDGLNGNEVGDGIQVDSMVET